ncbi:GTP cyclohydrolase FolE2 [Nitrincola sp. MINF-07-Sa-05]|uniref:GTP cyclohydrolase FolE2 n=1 Tax=Nitrincola salilacus TaxID=3400273 RepID=UPI00391841F4
MNAKLEMPDIAATARPLARETIDWVGMSQISLPVNMLQEDGRLQPVVAHLDIHVDVVNPEVKGIHMSRLYLLLNDFAADQVIDANSLHQLLSNICESHEGISESAIIQFRFDYPLKRPALKSEFSGWKPYPTVIQVVQSKGEYAIELGVTVPYSSTCPCSAALSRQLLQQAFRDDFSNQDMVPREQVESWLRSERGSVATPHSQRSYARIWIRLDPAEVAALPVIDLINRAEDALQTPVQTAVKREDEQEFARLNGANMMFCEDAARRLKSALNRVSSYKDFWVRVEHHESLHDHDAVAVVSKGIPGGYKPLLQR